MAAINIHIKISQTIHENEYFIGSFLDLCNAFKTVDHNILINELENNRVKGMLLSRFEGYLTTSEM